MKSPSASLAVFVAVAVGLTGCSKPPDTVPVPKPKTSTPAPAAVPVASDVESGVVWETGNVDAAFAKAKASNKPVFLYWGAVWCPPCNQVKATVFNRQDFIERARLFVPVYIDGDAPSAQHLGDRFKVSGYPTMILFKPDGEEITRLPGEVDADQYIRVLAMGMSGARPVKETLAAALGADAAGLSPDDWRMLAYYSWDTDEHRLLADDKLASSLNRLAQACPSDQAATATRLRLRALVAAANAKNARPHEDKAQVDATMAVLTTAQRARENFDLLVYYADNVTGFITVAGSSERARLTKAWTAALDRLAGDASVSTGDRLAALQAEVALARLDTPKAALPETLLTRVRSDVSRADQETKDPYARQAVISGAADLLATAGLMQESDALLTAELTRSHSPYYYMSGLADNASKRGDKRASLDWYEKAYAASDGPATRLQWGARYVAALIEFAPTDSERIEHAARSVIGELDADPDTFYARNGRALTRMGNKLAAWNKDRRHDASLARIRGQMAGVCSKLPAIDPALATCQGVFNAGGRA
jgi:thioredoxin-like negative regulator of GroEL